MRDPQPQTGPTSPTQAPGTPALAACVFLTIVPVTMVVPILKPLVQDLWQVGDFRTSIFMSINMIGALIAAPLAGSWSDRLGQRRPLILGALLIDGTLLFLLPKTGSYAAMMSLRLFEGAAHIFALSLILGIAADVARQRGSQKIMGAMGAALTLGVALGAPLGGILGKSGIALPLQVGAAICWFTAGIVWWLLREQPKTRKAPSMRNALALTLKNRALLVPYAFAFTDRFTVGFFVSSFPLYMANIHGWAPAQVGPLLAAFLLPFALLCYPMGQVAAKRSPAAFMFVGSVLYGLAIMPVAMIDVGLLPFLLVGIGVLSSVMFVPTLVLVGKLSGDDLKATAMGGFNAAGSLGFLVGPLVAGAVSTSVASQHGEAQGYAMAFVVAGAAEILCVLATLRLMRRHHTPAQATASTQA